jgi:hypothetical protein
MADSDIETSDDEEVYFVRTEFPIRLRDGSIHWEKIMYQPLDFLCGLPQRENCRLCLDAITFYETEVPQFIPVALPNGCLDALERLREMVRQVRDKVVATHAAHVRSRTFCRG